MLMDGTGVGELAHIWAENSKSQDTENYRQAASPTEPLMRCRLLKAAVSSASGDMEILSQAKLLQLHPKYNLLSLQKLISTTGAVETLKCMLKIFAFPIGKITAAKDQLLRVSSLESLTTNNILSAIVWSCITHVRVTRLKLSSAARVKIGFAINGRNSWDSSSFTRPILVT
jgi:trichothecene 3-O-acetyltransferase